MQQYKQGTEPLLSSQQASSSSSCRTCLRRTQVALVLAFVQLVFSGYALISQWALKCDKDTHHDSGSGSDGVDASESSCLNPAVFIVCRDVGCSIVLLLAGRIQAREWLWPAKQDRFIFVLIGICNGKFTDT
jgi:hypothetical protein